jgi:hypothetical protein
MQVPGYAPDLHTFPLEKLRDYLKHIRLLPSQQILKEDLDSHFAALDAHGIGNLAQLQAALKNNSAVQSFAAQTEIPPDYLMLLRREVNSYLPKPIKLSDFPGVKSEVVARLEKMGIKNTIHLYDRILSPEDRDNLAREVEVPIADILDLTRLTDVGRLKWVGPKFARLLVETAYNTVEKIATAEHEDLYEALVRTNEALQIYRGNFGAGDLKLWVEGIVSMWPRVIEYS